MPDEIAAAGAEVVEMLGACAADPDDLETARAADEALMRLEQVLAASALTGLLEELRRICAETAEIPIGQITADADLADDLGIDSLTRDEVVEKALGRYGLSNTVQAENYPTLRALADLIQRLGGEKN
jgi:acyl carrier protein